MDSTLRPYPSYKPSNFRWLGDMPAHWEVRRLRNAIDLHVSNVDKHVKEDEHPIRLCNYMDVYKNKYINEQINFMQATATYEEIERFRLERDDVLITKDSETWDDIGVPALVTEPASDLISGYHLALLRPRVHQLAGGYLLHALQSKCLAYQFHIEAKGVTRYGLSQAGIKSVRLPLPPLSEQSAIVCFLDYTERRIRRYIRAKQKLISLLEEQKRAITHQAVTGQVDIRTGQPYPAYKDSGVEWLGEAPEHWEVRKLGQFGKFIKGNGGNKEDELPEGVPCVRYGDLYTTHNFFIQRSRSYISHAKVEEYTPIRFGDLLFAASGETIEEIGKSAVNLIETEARCGGDVILFRASRQIEARYLGYAADCWSATAQKAFLGKGITVMHIYGGQLKYLVLTLPPLHEQTDIVRFLNQTTVKIDEGISRARREIKLLGEYRSRLVADVVTGKLDVREAATRLPQEADEFASIDDSDDLAGSEEPHGDIELAVSEAPA